MTNPPNPDYRALSVDYLADLERDALAEIEGQEADAAQNADIERTDLWEPPEVAVQASALLAMIAAYRRAERAEAAPKLKADVVEKLRGRIANYSKMLGNMGFYGPGDVALDEEAIAALSRPAPQKRPRKPYDGKWIKALTGLQIGESITVSALDKVANIVTAKRVARERLNAPNAQWITKATNRGRRITRTA